MQNDWDVKETRERFVEKRTVTWQEGTDQVWFDYEPGHFGGTHLKPEVQVVMQELRAIRVLLERLVAATADR